jgi:Uma2 family endonuclease
MATQERRWFTVDDYARMLQAGILTEDDRVELIDGEVREMSPIGPLHVSTVMRLVTILVRKVGESAIVSGQNPVVLSDFTEPQPDVAVLRPREDYYAGGIAEADDILLIIEVGDSSVAYDRQEKLPRYAEARVPEVWLVDVKQRSVVQFMAPSACEYQDSRSYIDGQTIECRSIVGLHVAMAEILGAKRD